MKTLYATILLLLVFGICAACQDEEVRKKRRSISKTSSGAAFEPEYISSKEASIAASSETIVADDGVAVKFGSGTVKTDYRVRLSKMSTPPDQAVVELESAKSAVVQVDIYDPLSNTVLPSSELSKSYDVTLDYSAAEFDRALGLMMVANPGQKDETTTLIPEAELNIERSVGLKLRENSQIRLRLTLAPKIATQLRSTQTEKSSATVQLAVTTVWLWLVDYDSSAKIPIAQVSADQLSSIGGQAVGQISVRRGDDPTESSSGGTGTSTSSTTGGETTTTSGTTGSASSEGGGLNLAGGRAVSAGDSFSCSLSSDGDIDCWGENAFGQIGDGTKLRRDTPTRIGASNAPWKKLSSGGGHSCAINAAGKLFCWGYNEFGQVGIGTNTDVLTPTQIGTDSDWSLVKLGAAHSCAIKTSGQLYCWGYNGDGEVGDGSSTDRSAPVLIGSDFKEMALGDLHTCALKSSGTRSCWGDNSFGKMGKGDYNPTLVPTDSGTPNVWQMISAGSEHTCGLRTNGQIFCWGSNSAGQLGQGNTTNSSSELQVGSASNWVAIEAGANFSCAIDSAGSLYCWGDNILAQMQTGDRINALSPTKISGDDWESISSGFAHSCGVKTTGQIQCHGANGSGQLGSDTNQSKNSATLISSAGTWSEVGAGGLHSCGTKSGYLNCWGFNMKGQLGLGTSAGVVNGTTSNPTQIGSASTWGGLSLGGQFSLANDGASIVVFGDNSHGQLGNGTTASRFEPGDALAWTISASAGDRHACGINLSQKLNCTGDNSYGQLGIGNTTSTSTATQVGSGNWGSVAAGYGFTCAQDQSSRLYCWGRNQDGNLGLGSSVTTDQTSPQQVGTSNDWFAKIATGFAHACAINVNDELYCWGSNAYGQIGNGNYTSQHSPVRVGATENWAKVAAGYFHTCALTLGTNKLFCWGYNGHGELGLGHYNNMNTPTQIGSLTTWQKLSANGNHTCAVKEDAGSQMNLYCWGINEMNQLGITTTTSVQLPAP